MHIKHIQTPYRKALVWIETILPLILWAVREFRIIVSRQKKGKIYKIKSNTKLEVSLQKALAVFVGTCIYLDTNEEAVHDLE